MLPVCVCANAETAPTTSTTANTARARERILGVLSVIAPFLSLTQSEFELRSNRTYGRIELDGISGEPPFVRSAEPFPPAKEEERFVPRKELLEIGSGEAIPSGRRVQAKS